MNSPAICSRGCRIALIIEHVVCKLLRRFPYALAQLSAQRRVLLRCRSRGSDACRSVNLRFGVAFVILHDLLPQPAPWLCRLHSKG